MLLWILVRLRDWGVTMQLANLVARIIDSDLNRDRRQDFALLSELAGECLQADAPLDTGYKIITNLYINYVKRIETASAFRQLASFATQLSRNLSSILNSTEERELQRSTNSRPFTIFLIDTDAWLGHLQILGSFLQCCSITERQNLEVIALSGKTTSKWARFLRKLDINYHHIPKGSIYSRLEIIKQRVRTLQAEEFSVRLIWITWPPLVFLGGLSRIAPTQIAWAMKYPFQTGLHYDEIIYAYGFGHHQDQKHFMHDSSTPIRLLPFYLTREVLQATDQSISQETTKKAREIIAQWQQKPERVAILSVARPEKLCNEKFLIRLLSLLQKNPYAHFFWCGKKGSLDAQNFQSEILNYQMQGRTTFLGWVHPWPVINQCDYFLDTCPFGSGVTLAQALRLKKSILIHQPEPTDRQFPEQMLVEEPNFNAHIIEIVGDKSKHVTILDDKHVPMLERVLHVTDSSIELMDSDKRYWDPFKPTRATHQLMVKRLLGISMPGDE